MTGPSSVLDPVDRLLRMFDAEADGKGLRLQGNPSLRQFPEGIVRRLTARQDQPVRPDLLRIADDYPQKFPPMDDEIAHPRSEAYLTSHLDKPAAEVHDHRPQAIRPDMGVGVDQNFGRPTHLCHNPFDPTGVRVLDPGCQFAVGKGARPTLPEMHMTFRVQDPSLPEGTDIGEAFRDGLAPLQEQDRHPFPDESQGGKKARRSTSDDDRPALRPGGALARRFCPPFFRDANLLRDRNTNCILPYGKRGAIRQTDAHQVDKTGRSAASGIDRPPDHPEP